MANLGKNFYPKLLQISSELGMKPEDLVAVMISESGMNPGAVEKKFKGSGLVQFMPDTLKGLGYKGNWEDFSKLSGEQQLDWVKKLVEGYKKGNNGQPFTSAAQYYVANLWPVALQLPGIKQKNPDTAFIEAHPATVKDKSGRKWSKKYHDIGVNISPEKEKQAYKYNPIFDKEKKGSITYGDMLKQVELNKQNPAYAQAMAAMKQQTGYDAPKVYKSNPSMRARETEPDGFKNFINKFKGKDYDIYPEMVQPNNPLSNITNKIDQYLKMFANKQDLKQLKSNNIVIKIASDNYTNTIEFARILCMALDEELSSKSYTHTNGKNVEIECLIRGPEMECNAAVEAVTNSVAESFEKATAKIGGCNIKTKCIAGTKSTFNILNLKTATIQHRKFIVKFL